MLASLYSMSKKTIFLVAVAAVAIAYVARR